MIWVWWLFLHVPLVQAMWHIFFNLEEVYSDFHFIYDKSEWLLTVMILLSHSNELLHLQQLHYYHHWGSSKVFQVRLWRQRFLTKFLCLCCMIALQICKVHAKLLIIQQLLSMLFDTCGLLYSTQVLQREEGSGTASFLQDLGTLKFDMAFNIALIWIITLLALSRGQVPLCNFLFYDRSTVLRKQETVCSLLQHF